jgi:hypothetical protein
MADTIIFIRDVKTGELIPIKATDNGDGTYTAGDSALVLFVNQTQGGN